MYEKKKEEIRKILGQNISDEVAERLKDAKNDVEFCRILADSGVDVEKFQKQLPEDCLDAVSGGYLDMGQIVRCPKCRNGEKSEISWQALISTMNEADRYRCRKCNSYFQIDEDGYPYLIEV